MAMNKLERIEKDIEKTKGKIAELQSCPEICRRPVAVGIVVQTDQVFFFHGEIHSSYLHFF